MLIIIRELLSANWNSIKNHIAKNVLWRFPLPKLVIIGTICARSVRGKFLHSFVCKYGAASRKTAVKCSSHHRQGISLSTDRKPRIDFEKTCSADRFWKGITTGKPTALRGGFFFSFGGAGGARTHAAHSAVVGKMPDLACERLDEARASSKQAKGLRDE